MFVYLVVAPNLPPPLICGGDGDLLSIYMTGTVDKKSLYFSVEYLVLTARKLKI